MKLQMKVATVLGALALAIVPAITLASQPANPGQGNGHSNGPNYTPETPAPKTPGPNAPLPEKEKAYGNYCKGQSKKHVASGEGHAVQPVRHRDGKGRQRRKPEPRPGLQGHEQKTRQRRKGNPLLPLRQSRRQAGQERCQPRLPPRHGPAARRARRGATRGEVQKRWRKRMRLHDADL